MNAVFYDGEYIYLADHEFGGLIILSMSDEANDTNDTLYIPIEEIVQSQGNIIIPLKFNCQTPTASFQIPITWEPSEFVLDTVTFTGTAVENWDLKLGDTDNVNQEVLIYALAGNSTDFILSDEDVIIANLHFINPLINNDTACILEQYVTIDSSYLLIDTTTIGGNSLLFVDTVLTPYPNQFIPEKAFDTVYPYYWSGFFYTPGDVEGNSTVEVNILDVTFLINYLYRGGPESKPPNSADVNGDCAINILDVTYLVNYLYKGGPAPLCGCVGQGLVSKSNANYHGSVSVEWIYNKSMIVINSTEELMGLEMKLASVDGGVLNLTNMVNGMQLYHNQKDGDITLAILDIEGEKILASGRNVVLEIDGSVEIQHVLGSNAQAEAVNLEIIQTDKNADLIPDEFSLYQNRPNPFNPITEISFSLPVASQVNLDVYNIAGQRVASIADGQYEAGNHSATWDASEQASGVYFYRMKAGEFVETRKMMLLK